MFIRTVENKLYELFSKHKMITFEDLTLPVFKGLEVFKYYGIPIWKGLNKETIQILKQHHIKIISKKHYINPPLIPLGFSLNGYVKPEEKVLVVKDEYIKHSLAPLLTIKERGKFIHRNIAEKDERFRQIIPYVIVEDELRRILIYKRKGSEARLYDTYSVGIGGHVNVVDYKEDYYMTIINAIKREVKEEIGLKIRFKDLMYLGHIHLSETEVDRVHYGLVYLLRIKEKSKIKFDKNEIAEPKWTYYPRKYKMESWSDFVLRDFLRR